MRPPGILLNQTPSTIPRSHHIYHGPSFLTLKHRCTSSCLPRSFLGHLNTARTGHRFYNADKGRWLQRDSIEENGGLGLYSITNNDTLNDIDLHGRISLQSIFAPENFEEDGTLNATESSSWCGSGSYTINIRGSAGPPFKVSARLTASSPRDGNVRGAASNEISASKCELSVVWYVRSQLTRVGTKFLPPGLKPRFLFRNLTLSGSASVKNYGGSCIATFVNIAKFGGAFPYPPLPEAKSRGSVIASGSCCCLKTDTPFDLATKAGLGSSTTVLGMSVNLGIADAIVKKIDEFTGQ